MEKKNNNYKKISVVVMAYNRDTYLEEALTSIVNQTLEREFFEVIVIKNFTSERLEKMISNQKFQHILIERPVSAPEMLSLAIKQARNDIMSFLEDDDLFEPDKLKRVFDLFNSDEDLVFHRNSVKIFFSGRGNHSQTIIRNHRPETPIKMKGNYSKKLVYYGAAFSLSSMSILKSVIEIDHLENLLTNQDMFILFNALHTKRTILLDSMVLTRSRVHDTNVSVNLNIEAGIKFIHKYGETYYQISDMIKGNSEIEKLLKIYMIPALLELHTIRKEISQIFLHDFPILVFYWLPFALAYDPARIVYAFSKMATVINRQLRPSLIR